MTTTSRSARSDRWSAAAADSLNEAPGAIEEPIGMNDPDVAHGGRSRRRNSPRLDTGLIRRVPVGAVLPTRVRRILTSTRAPSVPLPPMTRATL